MQEPGDRRGPRPPARIVVVDDHQLVAEALAETLGSVDGFEVAGIAPDLDTGMRLIGATQPDVVIMDVRLPDGDGAAGTADALRLSPRTRVIVLSAEAGIDVIARAVEAGAAGFLPKTTPLHELTAAVQRVLAGAALFTPELLGEVARHLRSAERRVGQDLSAREHEVLGLLSEGTSTQEMAETLFLSTHTIRNHIRNISAKLGAHSKLEAVAIATRAGLLDRPQP